MLFGLIFFVPFLGMAVGAAMGALSGSMADVGIDDRFIDEVRQKVTPGTSALFVMTSDAVTDKVIARFKDTKMELINTNLSSEAEQKLARRLRRRLSLPKHRSKSRAVGAGCLPNEPVPTEVRMMARTKHVQTQLTARTW